jgi:GNAT superfamily N-acetyltransferase
VEQGTLHEEITESALKADGGFWEIYRASFPATEREEPEVILRSIRLGSGLALRSVHQGRTVAIATAQVLTGAPAFFAVYLAVEPSARGTGAGGALFDHLFDAGCRRVPGALGMVWEVERVEDATGDSDATLRRRRIRFFEGHGGHRLPGHYVQPALDGKNTVPMHLFFRGTKHAPPVDGAAVERLARSIYLDKYRAVNGISFQHLDDLLAGRRPAAAPFEAGKPAALGQRPDHGS